MAGKKENEISNRISFALYVVTAFNCVFMLVSVACLCWNVNIHREISRIGFGFDPVIPSRHQERHVRSLLEPGSKEDLEFRKKEERRFSILGQGQESDNSNEPSHQATCSECKRICTLIFYHQPSKVTNSSENKEKICGGTLFDKSTVERFVGDFVEKRYGSVLQQFRLAHANGRNPRCPRFPFQDVKCSENIEHECLDSLDCDSGKICCSDGCEKICVQPNPPRNDTKIYTGDNNFSPSRENVCPKSQRLDNCPQVEHECTDDTDCLDGEKCCLDGCARICLAPAVVKKKTAEDKNQTLSIFVKSYIKKYIEPFTSKYNSTLEKYQKQLKAFDKSAVRKMVDSQVAGYVEPLKANISKVRRTLEDRYMEKKKVHTLVEYSVDGAVKSFDSKLNRRLNGLPKPVSKDDIKKIVDDYAKRFYAAEVPSGTTNDNKTTEETVSTLLRKYFGPLPSLQSVCPTPQPIGTCSAVRNHECDDDAGCSGGKKCCFNGCDRYCATPVPPTAFPLRNLAQPIQNSTLQTIVQSYVNQYLGPLPSFNASGQAPLRTSIEEVVNNQLTHYIGPLQPFNSSIQTPFSDFSNASIGNIADTQIEKYLGPLPQLVCPSFPRAGECPAKKVHECDDDFNCTGQQKCCLDGCDRKCVEPVQALYSFASALGPVNINSTVQQQVGSFIGEYLGGDIRNFNSTVRGLVKGYTAEFLRDDPANFNVTVKRLVKGYTSEFLGGDIRNFNSTVRGLVEGYTAEFLSKANVSGTSIGGGTLTSEDVKQIVLEQNRIIFENQATQGCIACTNASVQRHVEFYTRSLLGFDEGPFNNTVQKLVTDYLDARLGSVAKCPSRKIDPINCPGERQDQCSKDSDCGQGLKCCLEFCDKECVRPILPTLPPTPAGINKTTVIAIINRILRERGLLNITLRPGPPGINGSRGIPGLRGLKGSVGPVGPQGAQGSQGIIGPEGPKGDKGDQGDPGKDGRDGRDATTPDLKAVPGPPGPPGRDGREGKDGQRGPRGPRGFRGFKGQKGEPGKVPKTKEKPDLFAGFVKPNITRYPNATVVIKEGESLNMICDAIGVPLPEVYWVKQGTQQSRIGGKFSLNPAKREDTGKWQCVAKNVLGVETAPMDLTVYTKPVFRVEPPLQFTAYENRDSKFECEASGTPKPKIEWKRSGDRPLPKDGRHIVSGTTLILRNPRRVDSDIYVCQASNAGGTSVAAVDVIVNKFDPVEVIQVPPRSQRLRQIGETLIANCSAKGEPSPNITWYKNGVRVPSKERLINDEVFSQLHVQSFKAKDQGLYECRITSEFKKAPISNFMHVDLPKCRDPGRPKDGQRAGDEFFSGSVVKFSCNPGCFLHGSAIRICRPDGRWSGTQPICYYVGPVVAYECQHYKLLTEANRNQNYRRFLGNCDEKLAEGWYRFASGAGMQMATKCLPMNRCDSRLPGWFWGRLPSKKEGCITANVCFGTHRGGCCQRKRKILVRNCGKFYVYKLGPSPLCPARYCGE